MEEAQSPPPVRPRPAARPQPLASSELPSNPTTRIRRTAFRSDVRNTLYCVLAVGAVWLGYQVYLARRQVAAVAAIRSFGGSVTYADQLPFAARPWAPKWLRNALGNDTFISVIGVNLAQTQVSNGDLAVLTELGRLCMLSLDETRVGNAGLKHVAHLHYLEELRLRHTEVTDSGLQTLTGIASLRMLDLKGTQISDQGLMQLTGMPNLMQVHLVDTHVSAEGVRRFRDAAPTVIVQAESRRRRLRGGT